MYFFFYVFLKLNASLSGPKEKTLIDKRLKQLEVVAFNFIDVMLY